MTNEEESFPIRNLPGMRPSAPESPGDRYLNQALVRAADAAQYARPAIPEEQRGQIRVRLLNATPDPLGSVAALCAQYEGRVIRNLAEVTDADRRKVLDDMAKTVLNGPLEAVQFHFQIEGVTRSITHQMVRSRASFFAQESLRFAVPEGNWAEEIPRPAWLTDAREAALKLNRELGWTAAQKHYTDQMHADGIWQETMEFLEGQYAKLTGLGMPAEEARGVLPHDMPTRIHWVLDLRTLLAEAGKRTCTQAQFPWRMIFAGIASALRQHARPLEPRQPPGHYWDGWQFEEIANRLRPVCFQTGQCGFMAAFDRSCKIRERVDANHLIGRGPSQWNRSWADIDGETVYAEEQVGYSAKGVPVKINAIHDYEWAADPSAARS